MMKSTLEKRQKPLLPSYTAGEELFNSISHLLGVVCSLVFGGWALKSVSVTPTVYKVVSVIVYMVSLVTLYSMSMIYHGVRQGKWKRIFRVFDHCTIFLLIAGCYTPFCLLVLWHRPAGKVILALQWFIAAAGIGLNIWNMNAKPVKVFSQVSYVAMGWMITFVFRDLIGTLGASCLSWLFAGGLCYTVGILFYALGRRVRYMHCIWHVFVLAGTICQFVSLVQIL